MSKFDRVAGIINQAPRHWGEEAVLKTPAEVSALFHISTIHFDIVVLRYFMAKRMMLLCKV